MGRVFLVRISIALYKKAFGFSRSEGTNQFESYFKFLGVDPQQYELDFKQLKSLRDTIFHGRPIKDKEYLKKAIWYSHLPRFVGELMIKFFGISDLKAIEKRRVYG